MAGGGGAWKVAYADFVTAMMAFFMVMWITSQNQQIKEAVAHYFSDPFGALDANGKSGGTNATGPVLNPEPGARFSIKPTVIKDYNSKQFDLGTIIYFDPGEAELDDEDKAALDALIPFLDEREFAIEIRGHATTIVRLDGTMDGKYNDVWDLCGERSLKIRRYLEDWGIGAHRMRLLLAGEHEPASHPTKKKRQFENDRVEVYVPREVLDEDGAGGEGGGGA